jgi:biotin operon repressor
MDENQRKFTGVFIPADIYENQDISWIQKILWCEIQALSGSDYCYASNAHFAEHLGISEINVSKHISVLKKYGLVEIVDFNGRVRKMKAVLSKKISLPYQEHQGCLIENDKALYNDENININKKTRINYVNTVKSETQTCNFDPEYVKNEWNTIAKKINLAEIRSMTPERVKKLKARLKDQNMTAEDFIKEIKIALNESIFLRGKKWHEIPGHPNDSYWEDTDWRADFDFFLQPSSLQKAIEGKYADPSLKGKFH